MGLMLAAILWQEDVSLQEVRQWMLAEFQSSPGVRDIAVGSGGLLVQVERSLGTVDLTKSAAHRGSGIWAWKGGRWPLLTQRLAGPDGGSILVGIQPIRPLAAAMFSS